MIITNKHNLPEPLYRAIARDVQPRTGFSITDVIQPPRMTQLTRRHWDEIKEDASDRIWVLLGSSIHYILSHAMGEEEKELGEASTEEMHGPEPDRQRAYFEQPLQAEIEGVIITAHPDARYNHTIDDYKITSVWNIIFQPKGRAEYHQQSNGYAYINYLVDGTIIKQLRIWAILRDWQANKLKSEPDYPRIPIVKINIPVWPLEQTKRYLETRVKLHKAAETLPDGSLPLCMPDDMWQKPTTYAVMKPGKKSAVRVFTNEAAAITLSTKLGEGHQVQKRPGSRGRCERFCDVTHWCNQYKEYKCSAK